MLTVITVDVLSHDPNNKKRRATDRDKVGSRKVSYDPWRGADAHVTNEGEHPPAGWIERMSQFRFNRTRSVLRI